jgi:hypothetical protein
LFSRKIAGSQVPAPQLDLLSKIADVSSTPLPNTYAKPRTRLRNTRLRTMKETNPKLFPKRETRNLKDSTCAIKLPLQKAHAKHEEQE